MSGVAFISKTASEKEKQRKRDARQSVLDQAQRDHDKRVAQAERKAAKGADKWLSSGFAARLDAEKRIHGAASGSDSDTPKKKKKSKKNKKEKHKKKKKDHGDRQSSGSESESGGDQWVPAGTGAVQATNETAASAPPAAATSQRDSWMVEPAADDFFSSLGRRKDNAEKEQKRKEEEEKKNALDQPGQHPLELNKYWKDGGTGLPPEEEQARRQMAAKAPIGDGGKSWIRRAYQRAVEQADREGRTLAEVAAERWGSLKKLEDLLAAADGDSRSGARGDRSRRDPGGDRSGHRGGGFRRPDNNDDSRSRSRQFHRPGEDERDHHRQTFRRPDDSSSRDSGRNSFRRPNEDDGRNSGRSFHSPDEGGDRSGSRGSFRHPVEDRDRGSSHGFRRPAGHGTDEPDGGGRSHSYHRGSDDDDDSDRRRHGSGDVESRRDIRDRKQDDRSTGRDDRRSPPSATSAPTSSSSGEAARSVAVIKTVGAATPPSSTTESSVAQPAAKPAQPPVTDEQLNAIGAKIVKAELMGNKDLATRLQTKLSKLQERKKEQEGASSGQQQQQQPATSKDGKAAQPGRAPQHSQPASAHAQQEEEEGDEEVLLTRTDRYGNVRPALDTSEVPDDGGRRRRQKKVTTHGDGQRERYFADDDKFTLSEMVARERMATSETVDSALHRMSGSFIEKTNDDDYTLDDMYVSRAAMKQREGKEETRDARRAMAEHRRTTAALDRCHQCIDSARFSQQLVIAMGMKVYLSVPDHAPLTDGHCILAPSEHAVSFVATDEEIVQEIKVFQKGLVAMFKERDEDVIFLETCFLKRRRHMIIECIPVPKEIGEMAPIYFNKAIMDSEEEWSENKKLVDTGPKGLRRSIPKGFSYFSVEFGLDGGYAHLIEDEESFSWYFGREIIGGVLDADPQLWRKPRQLGPSEQKRKVMNFSKMWEPYDWTKRLRE